MTGTLCCVSGCNSNAAKLKYSDTPIKIKFFSFPKDDVVRKEWVQRCRRGAPFDATYKRICSRHFPMEEYQDYLKARLMSEEPKKLKPDALPSLNLPLEDSIVPATSGSTVPLKKFNKLQMKYDELVKENKVLKKKVNYCIEKYSVLNKKYRKHLTNVDRHIHKIFSEYFTENQLAMMMYKKKQIRWTPEEISRAYHLRHFSKNAYTYLRTILKYPLPGVSSLERWTASQDNTEK